MDLSMFDALESAKFITESDFQRWKKSFVFSALKGKSYGKSFCEYFSIKDYIVLFTMKDIDDCDRYIRQHYIR
jgi:hypothetical protein